MVTPPPLYTNDRQHNAHPPTLPARRNCVTWLATYISPKTFLCRRCKVPAQIGIEDGDIAFMRCPRCGVKVEGEIARRMYIEQAQYVNRKAAQDMFRRALPGGAVGRRIVQLSTDTPQATVRGIRHRI